MSTGNTTTSSLADSLPTLLMSARIVRENEGVMPQLVDKVTLGEGVGLSWNELSYAQITAQAITETTVLDNPQQLSDTLLTVTPSVIGIETLITDRVAARIDKQGFAKFGSLAQNAMQRKKDEDGIAVLDGFSTSLCGAGSTLTSGHIGAATSRIRGNTTEPGNPPFYGVLKSYQMKDIEDEILAGVGTYVIPEGMTARALQDGFSGKLHGATMFIDDNIAIDSSDDAKGGVFAKEAIVLVQGRAPRAVAVRAEDVGGGATKVYHYDEYAYAERQDSWGCEIYSDCTAPTS